jgi:hypothetical protein
LHLLPSAMAMRRMAFFTLHLTRPSIYLYSKIEKKQGQMATFFNIFKFSEVRNCLEGNTMSNRGAYLTKERMPSDRRLSLPAWKAVPDYFLYIFSLCTASQAVEGLWI